MSWIKEGAHRGTLGSPVLNPEFARAMADTLHQRYQAWLEARGKAKTGGEA